MELAALILVLSLVTFMTRYSMIAILGRWNVSPDLTRALGYVPIAAFAAIAAPDLFIRGGGFAIGLINPRFMAGSAAVLAAFISRNVLITLGTGMGVLWLMQAIIK